MATRVVIGNSAPIEAVKIHPDKLEVRRVPRPDLAPTVTEFFPEDTSAAHLLSIAEAFRTHHSDAPAAWVESDNPEVEGFLAKEFDCPVGRSGTRKKRQRKAA